MKNIKNNPSKTLSGRADIDESFRANFGREVVVALFVKPRVSFCTPIKIDSLKI